MSFKKLAAVLAFVCVGALASAQAESSRTISTLTELGRAPFKGTPEEACHLLKDHSISYLACIDALATCETAETMYLQDGTLLVTTTTNKAGGKHNAVTVKLELKYPAGHELAGQPLPADHPDRAARVCKQITADGVTFVIPDACDNPSLAFLPPQSAPDEPEREKIPDPSPAEEMVWQCVITHYNSESGEQHVHFPGVIVPGCVDVYIPGQTISFGGGSSRGYSRHCGWYPVKKATEE